MGIIELDAYIYPGGIPHQIHNQAGQADELAKGFSSSNYGARLAVGCG